MFLKFSVPKMLATEAAIFRYSYSQRTPLTGCYCILLKQLEPEPLVFENITNHSSEFTKNAQSRSLKRHFQFEYFVEFRICNI